MAREFLAEDEAVDVVGALVGVIEGGRIAWARSWGEIEAGSGVPVDTATLFQAASISKPDVLAAFVGDYFAVAEGAPPGPMLRLRLEQGVLRADVW